MMQLGVLLILGSWFNISSISPENCEKIKIGMTQAQVKDIIGLPRWEVKPKDAWSSLDRPVRSLATGSTKPHVWHGAKGNIGIWYTDGCVSRAWFEKLNYKVSPLSVYDIIVSIRLNGSETDLWWYFFFHGELELDGEGRLTLCGKSSK